MGALRWKRGGFEITRNLMARELFDQWILLEGKQTFRDALRNTRQRWFFGEYRARRRLYRAARTAFRRNGTFSDTLKKRADQLPGVVRSCGMAIRKLGYANLCTFDAAKVLAVVPRAIVQNDFKVHMLRQLSELPQVKSFRGLTERVITAASIEAETVLFHYLDGGAPLLDASGRGLIIEVDVDFPWKIGGVDGHYYYAYSLEEKIDLTVRKERKRFVSSLSEGLQGQRVHLKRLPAGQVADLRTAIELRRLVGGSQEREQSALSRVKVRIESETPAFSETV